MMYLESATAGNASFPLHSSANPTPVHPSSVDRRPLTALGALLASSRVEEGGGGEDVLAAQRTGGRGRTVVGARVRREDACNVHAREARHNNIERFDELPDSNMATVPPAPRMSQEQCKQLTTQLNGEAASTSARQGFASSTQAEGHTYPERGVWICNRRHAG